MRTLTTPRAALSVASAFAVTFLLSVAGCSSAAPAEDASATDGSELTASGAVSRAEQWANADLHYCQSPHGMVDPDDACWAWEGPSHRCERESVAAWNPYRSDCSGLVSWAWGLGAPGRVTGEFAPFQNDISHTITASTLTAGDAVNNSDHIMLFKAWTIQNHRATFIEEPGCKTAITHAHEFTSDVSVSGTSIHVDYVGMTFSAIRFDHFSGGGGVSGGGCVVGGTYCGGDKVGGSASTLYRCDGAQASVVEHCANGCEVRSGKDDICR